MKSLGWTLLLLMSLGLAGCGYRIAGPPSLGEPLAISITQNESRLVRSQAILQQTVGRVIQQRLGWAIAPEGPLN